MTDELRGEVRERYATAALTVLEGRGAAEDADGNGCCAPEDGLGPQLYDALDRAELPEEAVLASLGCGNPTAVADLREGETVLDLGSGGGIDVLLSAKRVGSTGMAYGVDMTEEMLRLARDNAARAGATNVEFVQGLIEEVPLPDGSVDVVISNWCRQSVDRQALGAARDVPTLAPRRSHRDQRRGRRGSPDAERPGGTRLLRRVHRGGPVVHRV